MSSRILVCDDHHHITRLVELVLRRSGYEVQVEENGLSAWEVVQRDPPDLLITDQEMPGLTGLELVSRIRKLQAVTNLPVILLTARAFELHESQLIRELRLPDILMKPFSPRELAALVKRMLATPQAPSLKFDRVRVTSPG